MFRKTGVHRAKVKINDSLGTYSARLLDGHIDSCQLQFVMSA